MKTISIALKAHYALPETSLVACLRLMQVDVGSPAIELGFTEHDAELLFEGITYKPPAGVNPTDVVSGGDLAPDNLSIQGAISDDAITDEDIRAGRWDYAVAELFMLNWADLTQGKLYIRYGHIGEVSTGRGKLDAEIRGLIQAYSTSIGPVTQPQCRHEFGDAGCGIDLAGGSPVLTFSGSVDSVSPNGLTLFCSDRTEPSPAAGESGFFAFGKVTLLTGANENLRMEVKSYVEGEITLQLPFPDEVVAGTAYSITAGCDLLHRTCVDRYSNAVNFDGEPFLPGNDKMVQVARST